MEVDPKRIHEARRASGLTWEGLAHATGLSISTIARLELGITKNPRLLTVRKIAVATGRGVDFFVLEETPRQRSGRLLGEVAAGMARRAKELVS